MMSRARRALRRAWLVVKGELHPERNRYRDVLILMGLALMGWAVAVASSASDGARRSNRTANHALVKVQEGRATSIALLCGIESAVAQAGRDVIDPPQMDTPFSRALERLGYPTLAKRKAQAAKAGQLYLAEIGAHIRKALRFRGKDTRLANKLLRPDGTINCRVLVQLSDVQVR